MAGQEPPPISQELHPAATHLRPHPRARLNLAASATERALCHRWDLPKHCLRTLPLSQGNFTLALQLIYWLLCNVLQPLTVVISLKETDRLLQSKVVAWCCGSNAQAVLWRMQGVQQEGGIAARSLCGADWAQVCASQGISPAEEEACQWHRPCGPSPCALCQHCSR